MNVGWLIDADLFGRYREELVTQIQAQGQQARLIHVPQPGYSWEEEGYSYRNAFPHDSCVIVLGDIELVTRVARETRWTPGAFFTVENYYCTHYYCTLGEYLLNQDYIMLPFGELWRQRDFLFKTLGREDQVFIRPDSPLKLFTGQLVARSAWETELEYMSFYDFPENELVVVSPPREVSTEWRFVVAGGQVVAGSQYYVAGTLTVEPEYDLAAYDLAVQVASSDYQPDPVWIIDICRTRDGEYRLLEIGAFSFADLYACDKAAVVRSVSAVALDVWNRSHE